MIRRRGTESPRTGEDPRPSPAAPRPDNDGPSRSRFRQWLPTLKIVIVAGSLIGLIWLLVTRYGQVVHALSGLGHAKPGVIVAAAACEAISLLAFAAMQLVLLRSGDLRLPIESVIGVTLSGNALSLTVPVAGAGLSAAFVYQALRRRKVTRATAAFVPVVSAVLSTVSLMVIVAAGALASGNAVAGIVGLAGAVAIVLAIAGVVLAARIPACQRLLERLAVSVVRLAQRVRRKSGQPAEVVARTRQQLADLHLSRLAWASAISLALLNWLGDAACLAFAIKAARQPVPIRDLLLVWSAGSGAASFGFTPGGVGVVEVALVAALVASGLTAAGAAVAVLIYRLISLWLSLGVGWILFLFVRRPRAKADSPEYGAAVGWAALACRPDLTTEELSKELHRQLGPRFLVTESVLLPPAADPRVTRRPEAVMVSLGPARLLRAEVTIVRRPEESFIYVIAGGIHPLQRFVSWARIVRKVRNALASAPALR
jgi:putative heme transporter